jgi:hypothetical protein
MSLIDSGAVPPRYILFGDNLLDLEHSLMILGGWQRVYTPRTASGQLDLILVNNIADGISTLAPHEERLWSQVPRIALLSPGAKADGRCDESISTAQSTDLIAAQIDRWRPTPDAPKFAEVARGFGGAALRPIAQGLSTQLQQAVAALDQADFSQSHRIAGLAGTLGFKRASRAWLAIDEGDLSDLPAARREARLATVAIERWLAATESSPDSAA